MSSSRQSENIRISDQHAVLLEETLRENRVLREKLAERDQQNAKLISELSSKVDSPCGLVAEKQETTKKKKKGSANRTNFHSCFFCLFLRLKATETAHIYSEIERTTKLCYSGWCYTLWYV